MVVLITGFLVVSACLCFGIKARELHRRQIFPQALTWLAHEI